MKTVQKITSAYDAKYRSHSFMSVSCPFGFILTLTGEFGSTHFESVGERNSPLGQRVLQVTGELQDYELDEESPAVHNSMIYQVE